MTLDITDYKTESWTVSKGIQDALWVLTMQIDKHVVPVFFETIQATATDHIDNPHTPFVGIIPTTDMTLAAAANKATLTGYDYSWYLTVQYVPSDERITEVDANPSETITSLLGGISWASVTGIEPYRINTVTDWANIKKSFEFGDRCTRWKAIQTIADYCNFVFVVKWRDVAGVWRPCAYFVHEDDIDSSTAGIGIPAAITITDPDSYLMDGVSVKDSQDHQYNRVLATGHDAATDTYYYATAQTAGVSDNEDIPIEYVYADASLNTQAKTETKAQDLLDFFQASAKVYVARFKQRMDLELYQKINFVGYDKIDTATMRITRISYSRSAANDIVEIEFSKDQAIQQLRRLARAVSPDYVSGAQDMTYSDMSDVGLIDTFDNPIAGGTAAADLWEIDGRLQPTDATMNQTLMLDVRGMGLYEVCSISGRENNNFGLWGWDTTNESSIEFMRWLCGTSGDIIQSYLEFKKDIFINNPDNKLYFCIDSFRPTHISGVHSDILDVFDLYVGGDLMFRAHNWVDVAENDFMAFYKDVLINEDITVVGAIKGDGNNDLEFKVAGAGKIKFTKV